MYSTIQDIGSLQYRPFLNTVLVSDRFEALEALRLSDRCFVAKGSFATL